MKTLGLVLVLVMVLGGACLAQTDVATFDVYSGWTLFSLPQVPIDPAVESVFSEFDMWFTSGLQKYDATQQRYIIYDPLAPENFGGMLLGDGFWFNDPVGDIVTYSAVRSGVPDTNDVKTDMWISLPGNQVGSEDTGGWHIIGQPFAEDSPVDPNFNLNGEGLFFTDGTSMKIWDDAVQAGWVEPQMLYWDHIAGRYRTMGYAFNDDDHLRAGNGYWIKTLKDNIAMIVPALAN